jgi:integrase
MEEVYKPKHNPWIIAVTVTLATIMEVLDTSIANVALPHIARRGLALTAARRIELLRSFARYCQIFDPKTEIPPLRLFGPGHRRLTPHIYTAPEIRALVAASARLYPANGLRPVTCATIFGLLSATGLRISEATALQRQDVDLQRGILHIRHTKFGKSRLVPLHSSTTHALQCYVRRRDQDPSSAATTAFFTFDHGQPARTRNLQYAFRNLCCQLGWCARGGHPAPRIHDLRQHAESRIMPNLFQIHRLEGLGPFSRSA